ncbi:hypothetical protein PLICRDRAFT_121707 [Plicaturopsis crispa FD-325 SS-3]|nr:hypothetical protein PLICRDRAFT_121707 [Plicaturopsis crispa FD-325 SS-3]
MLILLANNHIAQSSQGALRCHCHPQYIATKFQVFTGSATPRSYSFLRVCFGLTSLSVQATKIIMTAGSVSQPLDCHAHHDSFRSLKAFIALQCIGGGGILIILLGVLCSRGCHRLSTWVSLCLSWVLSTLSYTLLTLAGQQTGPSPAQGLCLLQAALIYGAPVLTTCTTLSLFIQLRDNLRSLLELGDTKSPPLKTLAVLTVPYAIYAIVLIEATIFGYSNPDDVRRNDLSMYCHIRSALPGNISAILCAIVLIVNIVFQADIAIMLHRNWRTLKNHHAEDSRRSLAMTFRALAFSLTSAVAIIAAFADHPISPWMLNGPLQGPVPNIILASMPVLLSIIFGCQRHLEFNVSLLPRPVVSYPAIEDRRIAPHASLGSDK